uniref:Cathepsin propeptide inhibitor domain-containing protein n=2 Tax=Triticum urartu TaxID=4572 RepID=A0A8R7VEX0_TRIUA
METTVARPLLAVTMVLLLAMPTASGGTITMSFASEEVASEEALLSLYERWAQHFGKALPSGGARGSTRFAVFAQSVRLAHQRGPGKLKLNEFADTALSNDYSIRCYIPLARAGVPEGQRRKYPDPPASMDWRTGGRRDAGQGSRNTLWKLLGFCNRIGH